MSFSRLNISELPPAAGEALSFRKGPPRISFDARATPSTANTAGMTLAPRTSVPPARYPQEACLSRGVSAS